MAQLRLLIAIVLLNACDGIVEASDIGQGGEAATEQLDPSSPALDCDGDDVDETPRSGSNCSACGDTCDVSRGLVCGFRGEWGCLRN